MANLCEICKKTYASYQSLWLHNKKYHKAQSKPIIEQNQLTSKSLNFLQIITET
jgi:hypothetical protein